MSILADNSFESGTALIDEWTQQVWQRTHQRIAGLSLRLQQNAIRIQGTAPSYYIKQLALEGLMMCIAPRHLTIHDGIQVVQN
jgi:hypothetical protein